MFGRIIQTIDARFQGLSLQAKLMLALVGATLAMGGMVTGAVAIFVPWLLAEHPELETVLDIMLTVYLVIGVLVVAGMAGLARIGARYISAPIDAAAAEAARATRLLREAVENVAVGFTIYDEQDRLVMCNDAYLRIYEESRDLIVPGATFEEIVRKGAERGQYKEAVGQVDAWVQKRVTIHQSARGEVVEQALGDGRWLMIIEHRTPSGYIVGNRIDITDLKRTSQALRQRELYLRATLDNLPFFFWLKDAESRFLTVNKVFSDACGRASPEELVGLSDFDVWPQALAERYQADDLEVIASRKEKAVEEPVAGGSEAGWIETYKKPVIAEDGTVLGTVGFARDISDRRFAEASLRDRNEQLNAIFELSPDGFVSFDAKHCVKYASHAFLRLTGLTVNEVVGLHEDVFSELLARRCLQSASFPGVSLLRTSIEVDVGKTAPGDEQSPKEETPAPRYLIEIAGPGRRVLEVGLRVSLSETVSQILYFRDVTHEIEVDQMKSEFLSTAAHELRTPLASIYGFSELLLAQEFEPEERQELIATIYRQSDLLVAIINELLDLARIEARRGKDFQIERVSACDLVQKTIAGFKTPPGRATPTLVGDALACDVRADRKKLMQAIGNVLSNAYKYSPGGGEVRIDFIDGPASHEHEVDMLGIRISDQGIGMRPEAQARLFERFFRADTSGKIPGTGLGMSIVKEIIDLLDGCIEVHSRCGEGTQITLWLPCMTHETVESTT